MKKAFQITTFAIILFLIYGILVFDLRIIAFMVTYLGAQSATYFIIIKPNGGWD